MRLAGQQRGGFYPAPPEAINEVLPHLRAGPSFSMLDPCCGEGKAIQQLAEGLACPLNRVHAIELSDVRAEKCKTNLAGAKIIAPASFEGCAITSHSFGFIWCNSPFDDEIGGGERVEYAFLLRATRLLCTKGVLAFVLPEYVVRGDSDMQRHLMANFRQISMLRFPEEHRKYDECVILAVKRGTPVTSDKAERILPDVPVYDIPESRNPSRFEKVELTDTEVLAILANSPLRRSLLTPKDMDVVPRPPIPLGAGHTALLVASGQLDGIVRHPDEPPHVVRGTVRKSEYLARTEVKENAKSTSTTQIYSERITPIVRVATVDGEIITIGAAQEESDEL